MRRCPPKSRRYHHAMVRKAELTDADRTALSHQLVLANLITQMRRLKTQQRLDHDAFAKATGVECTKSTIGRYLNGEPVPPEHAERFLLYMLSFAHDPNVMLSGWRENSRLLLKWSRILAMGPPCDIYRLVPTSVRKLWQDVERSLRADAEVVWYSPVLPAWLMPTRSARMAYNGWKTLGDEATTISRGAFGFWAKMRSEFCRHNRRYPLTVVCDPLACRDFLAGADRWTHLKPKSARRIAHAAEKEAGFCNINLLFGPMPLPDPTRRHMFFCRQPRQIFDVTTARLYVEGVRVLWTENAWQLVRTDNVQAARSIGQRGPVPLRDFHMMIGQARRFLSAGDAWDWLFSDAPLPDETHRRSIYAETLEECKWRPAS